MQSDFCTVIWRCLDTLFQDTVHPSAKQGRPRVPCKAGLSLLPFCLSRWNWQCSTAELCTWSLFLLVGINTCRHIQTFHSDLSGAAQDCRQCHRVRGRQLGTWFSFLQTTGASQQCGIVCVDVPQIGRICLQWSGPRWPLILKTISLLVAKTQETKPGTSLQHVEMQSFLKQERMSIRSGYLGLLHSASIPGLATSFLSETWWHSGWSAGHRAIGWLTPSAVLPSPFDAFWARASPTLCSTQSLCCFQLKVQARPSI